MFSDLSKRANEIIAKATSVDDAIARATHLVSSEVSTRSKTILSDMLDDLTNSVLETEFFADISKQNAFYRVNLQEEILGKYQFAPSASVNYVEASRALQALKVGGLTFAAGAAIEVGVVLIAGLSLSSLVPIPLSALIVASIGAALTDYYAIEPARNKKNLAIAFEEYLRQAKQQFLNWFDEVEHFFNQRVEEIKQTI
jgi:hypothetical protein